VTESRRHDLLALALLAFVLTLLFVDVLAGWRGFYLRDLTSYYRPTKHVLREIVEGGEFPYWNRYLSAGQPMAANPEHEVFYPLTWLILLPSFDLGYRLLILAHLYILTFGMYALLRSMRVRAPAAAIAAFSFGAGGVMLSSINLLPILFSAAWLPLTVLFARRHLIERSRRDFALAALFLGIQLLVGEPVTVLQTGMLIGIYAVHRGLHDGGVRNVLRNIAIVALMCIAALAVSAVQMLPAIDHVGDSVRARGFTREASAAWSAPFARLAELVYPNLLGHPADDRLGAYWGRALYPNGGVPFYYAIYPGLLITAAAAGGLLARRPGAGLAATILGGSILLALGSHTPLFDALHAAGITRYLRYPEKFLLTTIFALTVFGARVIDDLLGGDERVRRRTLAFIAGAAAIAIAAALLLNQEWFRILWRVPPNIELPLMSERSRVGWAFTIGRLLLLFFALRMIPRLRPVLAVTTLAGFMLLDLAPLTLQNAPRMPASFFAPPAAARQFPEDRRNYRLFHIASWRVPPATARLYTARRAERHWVLRNAFEPNTTSAHGIPTVIQADIDQTDLLPAAAFTDAVWSLSRAQPRTWIDRVAAMANVRWVGIYRPFGRALADARGDFTRIQPVQFVEGRRYPRYYFASDVVSIRDARDFVTKAASESFDKQTAFIAGPAFKPARGIVQRWTETANTARIDVETDGRGFLVMSITPHKYWRVQIDGKPAPAIVTNIGFQGVVVPAGRHVVTMRYRNPRIGIGALVSIAALILLAVIAMTQKPETRNQKARRLRQIGSFLVSGFWFLLPSAFRLLPF